MNRLNQITHQSLKLGPITTKILNYIKTCLFECLPVHNAFEEDYWKGITPGLRWEEKREKLFSKKLGPAILFKIFNRLG